MRRGAWRLFGLTAGAAAFALLLSLDSPLQHFGAFGARPARAAAVAALMAIWWLTEALPIHWTACVPLLAFPLLGVFGDGPGEGLARSTLPYLDPYIFLFMGGMAIAAAMHAWRLDRRIALRILAAVGVDPRRLLLGFLAATAFISLWISNTATATLMVPIGIAVLGELEIRAGGRRLVHFGAAVMLAIAYAANVGGIGTKIGTAPNAQLSGFLETRGMEVSFLGYMAVGLPFVALLLPLLWLVLWRVGRADAPRQAGETIAEELERLGRVQRAEWMVLGAFGFAAALWIAGGPLTEALAAWIPGLRSAHVEGGVSMIAALSLFALRAGGRPVLTVRDLRVVPWETLLLLGGSFSMAEGIQQSGLSHWLGGQLTVLREVGPFWQVLCASTVTVLLSAVTSNTATTAVMLNVLAGAVASSELTTVLFAATIAASCDFALPAGTPPNAIVFGSGYVTIPRMAKTGILLDLVAAALAAAWCWLSVRWVMG